MKTHKFLHLCFALLAFVIASCSSDDEVTPDNSDEPSAELIAAEAYFNNTLKDFITNNCVSCHTGHHSQGNSNYSVFTNARNNATNIFNQVNTGAMPQGSAKLPVDEIENFQTFKDLVDAIP